MYFPYSELGYFLLWTRLFISAVLGAADSAVVEQRTWSGLSRGFYEHCPAYKLDVYTRIKVLVNVTKELAQPDDIVYATS